MIKYQLDNISNLTVEPTLYFSWIKQAIKEENHYSGDIFYHFCSDEFLLKINRTYLQHDYLTDIITFPLSTHPDIISGEVFISVERVRENAALLQTGFEREFARVLIHGVLHLLGYADLTDEEKLQMRAKEDYYLSLLPQK
ncbi:Metal-dependent hydrolase YbeY, involved in rRNA and/or ribosome maturation and assembly [hydrothermal vent metagenome]|uniref:Metal-dependent hydrolase YbeY, involved in rRNA and/or ribosome maturation and assembly n=1 Tax=hydrothermal vent metagenome TaxID=652676 RepID=A0A3B0V9Y0_9ZZZZ